jgi:rRNA maturation endonuclease Nob1
MTGLSPHMMFVALVTTAAGALMFRLGLQEGYLRIRRERRRCVSCGREFRPPRGCPHCG